MEAEFDRLGAEETISLRHRSGELNGVKEPAEVADPRETAEVDAIAGDDGAGAGAGRVLHRPARG